MEANNFKQLEQQEMQSHQAPPDHVEEEVMGIIKTGHFFGDVIELYFTKIFEIAGKLLGTKGK